MSNYEKMYIHLGIITKIIVIKKKLKTKTY